jgi:hypothetical protein
MARKKPAPVANTVKPYDSAENQTILNLKSEDETRMLNLPRFDGHGNLREKERGPDVREKEEQGVQ